MSLTTSDNGHECSGRASGLNSTRRSKEIPERSEVREEVQGDTREVRRRSKDTPERSGGGPRRHQRGQEEVQGDTSEVGGGPRRHQRGQEEVQGDTSEVGGGPRRHQRGQEEVQGDTRAVREEVQGDIREVREEVQGDTRAFRGQGGGPRRHQRGYRSGRRSKETPERFEVREEVQGDTREPQTEHRDQLDSTLQRPPRTAAFTQQLSELVVDGVCAADWRLLSRSTHLKQRRMSARSSER
uniref:Uncharacterized protein n=1 Tax=Knipowitschia caucasica TaxID=637954 RepID=A0AAV2MFP5_KNICA